MRRTLFASGMVSAALAATLVAQQPRQSPTPVFRGGADYVRVDVVVTDKNDRPISDLTKDDFVIVDQGRQQTIDAFEFISVPVEHRTLDSASSAADPSADVATNTPPSTLSRLFVMVIDDLHILEQDIISVKRIMTRFFQALSPDDEVAVVFVSHSNLSQNFTSHPALLKKTIDHVRDALGFGLDALGRSSGSNVVNNRIEYICACARTAAVTLKSVTMSLAGSAHTRRAVVYVTGGSIIKSPAVNCDFSDIQDVYDAARRADVPIYTIDPRGQVQPDEAVRGGIGAIGNLGGLPGEAQRALIVDNIQHQQDRLAETAINTGGRAFTNQSNLMQAVDEIVADNGSYYLLGYYPNPFAADGKFHEFSVKVNRPGVRVRARSGYVASTAPPSGDAKPMLDGAMSAGMNVSAVALRAFATPMMPGIKGSRTLVTVEVTYPPRPGDSGRIDDELQVRVLALSPDAEIKASSGGTLRFNGEVPDAQTATVLINGVVELPPQPLTLRVGVASGALGKAGSVQLSVDVPNLSGDKLQLSGIALGLSGVPAPALNATAIESLVPFQPVATRTFTATDSIRVFGRAFWRSKELAVVTIQIKGASASLLHPALTMSPGFKGGQTGAFDATVPLTGFTPGRYVLEITGQLPGGKPVIRDVPFAVQ